MTDGTPAILPQVARGEADAVRSCLDRYGNLVWSMALRWCANRADAEDAVQDIFVELWRTADRFDGDKGSEAAFVAMISRRRLIDRHRSTQREHARRGPDTADLAQWASEDHHVLERHGEAVVAARAFRDLPPERKQVLRLSICEGLTHEQISTDTGIPVGTVKSHVRRGLNAVRNRLKLSNESLEG